MFRIAARVALHFATLALAATTAVATDFPFGTASMVVDSVNATTQQDVFTYTATATDRVYIRVTVTSGDFEPSLNIRQSGTVINGGGQSIGPVYDPGWAAYITSGVSYDVLVPRTIGGAIGVGSGSYRVFYQSATNPVGAVALTLGQTVAGSLGVAGQIDSYTFTGQAGDLVRIRTHRVSGQVDPIALVYASAPNTASLASVVIPCTGTNGSYDDLTDFTEVLNLQSSGTFLVMVGDSDDSGNGLIDPIETGDYTIALDLVDQCSINASTSSTTSTISTTSTTGDGSTTTTLPGTVDHPVAGRMLALRDNAAKPKKKALALLSKDATIAVPANGGDDDPRDAGATLRVVTTAGDAFDDTYPLAAAHWSLVGAEGQQKGYRFADPTGPVRAITLKPKTLKLKGAGASLGHSLGGNPNPVDLVLTMGGARWCAHFGGTTKFKTGKTYTAKIAAAPGTCP